jgi:nicotine blue oxidoreductase
VAGLLLAAGAGRRMGGPKALLQDAGGTAWVTRAALVLSAGGCTPVLVVAGAAAEQVVPLLPEGVPSVVAADWAEGMGASLRAGLAALARIPAAAGADAVLIGLVDTPGVDAAVVTRLLGVAGPEVLARAAYHGKPGHPVLLGRRHWAAVAATAAGDAGARGYLAGRDDVRLVECGDVGSGDDLDVPADLDPPAGLDVTSGLLTRADPA